MAQTTTDQHSQPIYKPVSTQDLRRWDKRHKTPWEAVQQQRLRRLRNSKEVRRRLRVEVFSKFFV